MPATPQIETLPRERSSEAVAVLCEAFADYPVMRFIIGDVGDAREGGNRALGYPERLELLVSFFTAARFLRDDLVLAVVENGRPVAVANVNRPTDDPLRDANLSAGTPFAPQLVPELEELRRALWRSLGEPARRRYEAYGRATAKFVFPEPHYHLGMIGVSRSCAGCGLGRRLLDHLHEMSRSHPESRGVSLTTESAGNVALYRHFGYEIVGHERIGELESWGFFRRDPEDPRRTAG